MLPFRCIITSTYCTVTMVVDCILAVFEDAKFCFMVHIQTENSIVLFPIGRLKSC